MVLICLQLISGEIFAYFVSVKLNKFSDFGGFGKGLDPETKNTSLTICRPYCN